MIEHYCGATADSAGWSAMCRRIAAELSFATGIEIALPTRVAELETAFKDALSRLCATHRVVLIIDALNQLADEGGAQDLA